MSYYFAVSGDHTCKHEHATPNEAHQCGKEHFDKHKVIEVADGKQITLCNCWHREGNRCPNK
jgi:hypothetical protein